MHLLQAHLFASDYGTCDLFWFLSTVSKFSYLKLASTFFFLHNKCVSFATAWIFILACSSSDTLLSDALCCADCAVIWCSVV